MSAMFIIVLGLPRPDPLALCTFGAQKVTTSIDSRMLSTTVASPCQTRDVSSIAYAQFAEGLHFSAFHCYSYSDVHRYVDMTN